MVISGGVNIYPAEIEAALHAVPGVHDCAVFGIPDAEFGEALMAVVEPQPGVTLDIADIRTPAQVLAGRLQGAKTRRNPGTTCRARIPARSSSAACAIPIGSGRGGGFSCPMRARTRRSAKRATLSRVPACFGAHLGYRRCCASSGTGAAPLVRDDACSPPPSLSCTAAKNLHTPELPGSFWSSRPCHPRSCLPTLTCVPTAARISRRTPGFARTSGCSGASSAIPCATRKAPTCSTWSSASGRPRSGSTAMTTSRRGASSN